jgi:glyoxylase-like metal-dependent hydrolase (beta-lactamase superfamily II)
MKEQHLTTVNSVSPGLWQISLPFQGEEGVVGSYLLSGKDQLALVDPGPGSTVDALLQSIREAGFEPQDVTHILLTHIHLDHAGATGTILHSMPKAKVVVHSKGAPHIIDTSKLIASATRIYGERMHELWGKIESVPQDRLQIVEGGEVLNFAGRRLEVHYTPGHAIHHVVFFDVHSGELFAGDTAGVCLANTEFVRPPTPPPDLDIDAWSSSIDLLKKLRPDVLYIGHFGQKRNPIQILEGLRANLFTWGDIILSAMRDGKNEVEIIQVLRQSTEPEVLRKTDDANALKRYDLASNYEMTVQGYMRYWKKHHAERL